MEFSSYFLLSFALGSNLYTNFKTAGVAFTTVIQSHNISA